MKRPTMPRQGAMRCRGPAPLLCLLAVLGGLASCTPTVQVNAPKDPITINLNIKLDADVRLKIEERAKEDVGTKPIF